jgi:uncharacterized protein YeaO (DUF488 family)
MGLSAPRSWSTLDIMPLAKVRVARVYDRATADDDFRVLVDRLWPRGLSKSAAALDLWCHALAPSTELRRWFGHEPTRREEFASRYESELASPELAQYLDELRQLAREHTVTLLTATKDLNLSHVPVLARIIESDHTGPGVTPP